MNIPLREFNKPEIIWMDSHFCPHRHRFIEHRQCYRKGMHQEERIGFLDIEVSNLKADYGVITCWCLKKSGGDIIENILNKKDISKWGYTGKEDTRVIKSLVEALKNFDKVVGHYSSRFDIPYVRTRAVM